jgi:hypothetical protein
VVKVETLIEQTSLLLEKQKEAQQECVEIFKGLLSAIDKKREQAKGNAEDNEALERVHGLVAEQVTRIQEDTQVDIDFLAEQLEALRNIQAIKDPGQRQEMLGMLLDEDEDIKDTETFKKELTEEAAISKQNLVTMVNDLKEAIKEGGAQDVALYLESLLEEDSDGDEDDEDECDDDDCDDECCQSSKKSCGSSKSCGDGCGGCGGLDLFAELTRLEKESDSPKKSKK